MTTVFHQGELLIQAESGVDQRIHKMGNKLIRDHIIDQHKEFFEHLSYVFIALHDEYGRPWVSVVQGDSGFIDSPDQKTLNISGEVIAKEALCLQTHNDMPIGIVGLDLSNRRRNRLNGNLNAGSRDDFLSISVAHSFGNCPKYIQVRDFISSFRQGISEQQQGVQQHFCEFSEHDINLITQADTLFIASSEKPGGDLDVNHRGGKPNFVHVENNKQFWFNDYPGNNYFQTFGNIHIHSNIGLMFIDFDSGDLLLMSGKAHLEKAQNVDDQQDGNSQFIARRCYFALDRGLRVKQAIKGTWSSAELSPFLGKDLD